MKETPTPPCRVSAGPSKAAREMVAHLEAERVAALAHVTENGEFDQIRNAQPVRLSGGAN